jgi:hypothetical protein
MTLADVMGLAPSADRSDSEARRRYIHADDLTRVNKLTLWSELQLLNLCLARHVFEGTADTPIGDDAQTVRGWLLRRVQRLSQELARRERLR